MSSEPRAVLFRSERRFQAFHDSLRERGVSVDVLDFTDPAWQDYDFRRAHILIYFPHFEYTSNHPLALHRVQDELMFLHRRHPHLRMFPDPRVTPYYSDKYRQLLFLRATGLPHPRTLSLDGEAALARAERELGYPMVIKNRFGAGGDYVFKVDEPGELRELYRLSRLDMVHGGAWRRGIKALARRSFHWHLWKNRRLAYPFLSPPLLAQQFISHESDLKTVVGDGEVVEAHWRHRADPRMWKMNIDGGGIGEWSHVPPEPLRISEQLARQLGARWLNVDIMRSGGDYLVSEFSPVWHHYAYREKASFVYKDDYNIPRPLREALDLERMVVASLLRPSPLRRAG
ncbi:ATP-grasp domain-containing protein [Alkalilimnicola sp. S0819]|uniref:ATP-grasp domain-containing protein n=1 Tax=Alkalilimnicola sp. S0819 TaxID=2613922 RepID=UPI001261A9D8|nr:hypothetical protein [Alkalilimnicola sp. S0819]KAB7622861.1 hypothetical protein F3N43_11100 [Alkalilimnicola sp. S0819]MPQ17183.1 hypothetical protein [Alkalilimnicola sp. S0819]